MPKDLRARIERLEAQHAQSQPDDSVTVLRDREGCILNIGLRFAYHFNGLGEVIALRYAGRIYERHGGETLADLRTRIMGTWETVERCSDAIKEFIAAVSGWSRGLPSKHSDESPVTKAEHWARQAEAARELIRSLEKRQTGESEWGERAISFFDVQPTA